MFGFFTRRSFVDSPVPTNLTPREQEMLLDLIPRVGLNIVAEARGPVPLLTFGRRILEQLDSPPRIPLPYFSAALKRLIQRMDHERLRILSPTDLHGVGYVYNAEDPETWPVRTGR